MDTKLHGYWYLRSFTEIKHGEIDVVYEDGVYKAETPEFPCDIPDGDEAYELPEQYLNKPLGDANSFYFFSKEANEDAAYKALEQFYQKMLADAKANVIVLENQCEKIGKLKTKNDAILRAMIGLMCK